MASSVVKQSSYASQESIQFGNLSGMITRLGNLRIISVYNGTDEQSVTTWQLAHMYDYPAQYTSVGAWLPIDNNQNYGSRYLIIRPNGSVTLSGSFLRGGFTAVYAT